MKTSVIGIRIDAVTSSLIDRIIKYKLANSKADAIRFIMLNGMKGATGIVERKEAAEKILSSWHKKGFPRLPKDLSKMALKERE
ncbi:MAG: hypothetical protein KIY11_05825 [Thermoplasmata archaeon]|nr:hypothetical protein [Candidatus Sysuiplasma acidicola]